MDAATPVGSACWRSSAGLREVVRDSDLRVVMALMTGQLVIFGGLEVLLVLLAIDLLGIGESGAGYLIGALGLGGSSGRRGIRARGPTPADAVARRRGRVIGLPVALIGVDPAPGPAAVLLVLSGIGSRILEVAGQTLLQRITPDAVRARVFGMLEGLLLVGEAMGSPSYPRSRF